MKVKIHVPCIDADLNAPVLHTKNGVLDIHPLRLHPIQVDCMPDTRKE